MRRLCMRSLFLSPIILLGALLVSSPASAAFPFSRSPGSGPPGTVISVSGSLCANPANAVASIRVTLQGTGASTTITPDLTSWSGQLTVPAGTSAGSRTLIAECLLAGISADQSTATFDVTASESATTTPVTSATTSGSGSGGAGGTQSGSGGVQTGSGSGRVSSGSGGGSSGQGSANSGNSGSGGLASSAVKGATGTGSGSWWHRHLHSLWFWLWLLLLLILVAAIAVAEWMRRHHHHDRTPKHPQVATAH